MKSKKLTREEAIDLKAALRAIQKPLEALLIEWEYHILQEEKVAEAVDALLRSQGLEPYYDPESGKLDGARYVGKLHLNWWLRLRLEGYARWDLANMDVPNVEQVKEWLKEENHSSSDLIVGDNAEVEEQYNPLMEREMFWMDK